MFGKKLHWKTEYDDTLYKIYDWDGNLAGYLFPNYGDIEPKDQEDEIIEQLNKNHARVFQASLLLPMVKLGLLDRDEGMDLDHVIFSLEENARRSANWKNWLRENAKQFGIVGAEVHTAREDRNMLSIGLLIEAAMILGEKEVLDSLTPLLNKLHESGLL